MLQYAWPGVYIIHYYNTEFTEVPSNVRVKLGTTPPPLRCCHTSSQAIITWIVNGSPVRQFPDIRSGFVNESGNIVNTLTIPAELQYNGTVVECLAVFIDGSPTERAPAATILFTPTNSSTSVRGNATQFQCRMHWQLRLLRLYHNIANFNLVPSPLTVAVEQGTASFQCQHPFANGINWLLNGTSPNRAGLISLFSSVHFTGSIRSYALSFGILLEYNQTTVQCVAIFTDGSPPQFTEAVTLLIQGLFIIIKFNYNSTILLNLNIAYP